MMCWPMASPCAPAPKRGTRVVTVGVVGAGLGLGLAIAKTLGFRGFQVALMTE